MIQKNTNKIPFLKILLVSGFFVLFSVVILGRAYQLQILGNAKLNRLVKSQHKAKVVVQPKRGTIFDRHGNPLAVDILVASVGIHPHRIIDKENYIKMVGPFLTISKDVLRKKMSSQKKFEWLERRIPVEKGKALSEKKLAGLQIVHEYRRYYPNKHLAGQLLGAVGYDAKALGGVELSFDNYLKSKKTKTQIKKDAKGRFVELQKDQKGLHNLYLTIDKNIQYFTEKFLQEGILKHNAKSGFALVLKADTGEILALANYPFFNPNRYWTYPQNYWRNQVITDTFEPGSTFKTFLLAAALESGKVKQTDTFFCENGSYRIGKHVIKDHGSKHGNLTAKKIFQLSSNIGVTKIAKKIGKKTFYDAIKKLQFGEKWDVGLLGESSGAVRDYKKWQEIELSNMAFGQGLSVTGLQMAAAYTVFSNGGYLLKPFLVKRIMDTNDKKQILFSPEKKNQVFSEKTASELKDLLFSVTQPGGTAQVAHLEGYLAAGKTGTAQKFDLATKSYANGKYISSFIGMAPLDNPELIIYIVFDESKNGYYGGLVAGPVFRNIAKDTLSYLGIVPEHKLTQKISNLKQKDILPEAIKIKSDVNVEKISQLLEQKMMPDLTGFSLRTVLKLAQEQGIKMTINGTGFVVKQTPSAGESFSQNWSFVLSEAS